MFTTHHFFYNTSIRLSIIHIGNIVTTSIRFWAGRFYWCIIRFYEYLPMVVSVDIFSRVYFTNISQNLHAPNMVYIYFDVCIYVHTSYQWLSVTFCRRDAGHHMFILVLTTYLLSYMQMYTLAHEPDTIRYHLKLSPFIH